MPTHEEIVATWLRGQPDSLRPARELGRALGELDPVATGLAWARWWRSDAVVAGIRDTRRSVELYAKNLDRAQYFADRRLLRSDAAQGPLRSALDVVAAMCVSILGGGLEARHVEAGLLIAFGGDPASQVFGALLRGEPLPGDPVPGDVPIPFPEVPGRGRLSLDRLERAACFGGLRDALNELAAASSALGRTQLYPGMTITDLSPRRACGGDTITVQGKGFGATQPQDAAVVFGSTRATVVPGSWSDTSFQVRVPADATECCVSVLKIPRATGAGPTLASAISTLGGVAGQCFGKVGIAFAGRLEQLAGRIPDSESATCNPDGSNRFVGGRPRIVTFKTGLGVSSPQRLAPGQAVTLDWVVENAQSASLTLTPAGTNSPLAVVPTLPSWFVADPRSGNVTLPSAGGLLPWQATATLEARNPCGSATATIVLDYSPSPGVVFVGGGMRSSFHLGASEAIGALVPVKPVVCSGSGLGALSAMCVAADHPNPASLRAFWRGSVDDTAWFTLPAALSAPGLDTAAIGNARWQTDARAEVLALGALDQLRPFLVPYRPGDGRYLEKLITMAAGVAADEAVDALGTAVGTAFEEAGQTALSYVPIVAIVWAAAKWGLNAYVDNLKQQTATLLASVPAVLDPTRQRALIATALTGVEARLAASGCKLRIPLASLERGVPLYGMEGGALSKAPVMSEIVANTTAPTFVTASATVPLLGPPVAVGTDSLLDGSVRDPVPIAVTIEAGAGTVIVVQPNVRTIGSRPSFAAAGVPSIDVRSALMRDAQFLDGAVEAFGHFGRDPVTLEPVGRWRAPVYTIEPSVDILGLGAAHGEIGLTRIMSDYGYMRTFDTLAPWILFPGEAQRSTRDAMTAALRASTDSIVGLRVAAWELEHHLNGMRATVLGPTNRIGGGPLVAVPDDTAIGPIRDRKTEIRAAIMARLAIPGQFTPLARPGAGTVSLPAYPVPRSAADSWFLAWEEHSFPRVVAPTTPTPATPDGDPWVSLGFGGRWTVPAAVPPPPIVWP